jgi:hypothetical protein
MICSDPIDTVARYTCGNHIAGSAFVLRPESP